jgi:hypothetical protein
MQKQHQPIEKTKSPNMVYCRRQLSLREIGYVTGKKMLTDKFFEKQKLNQAAILHLLSNLHLVEWSPEYEPKPTVQHRDGGYFRGKRRGPYTVEVPKKYEKDLRGLFLRKYRAQITEEMITAAICSYIEKRIKYYQEFFEALHLTKEQVATIVEDLVNRKEQNDIEAQAPHKIFGIITASHKGIFDVDLIGFCLAKDPSFAVICPGIFRCENASMDQINLIIEKVPLSRELLGSNLLFSKKQIDTILVKTEVEKDGWKNFIENQCLTPDQIDKMLEREEVKEIIEAESRYHYGDGFYDTVFKNQFISPEQAFKYNQHFNWKTLETNTLKKYCIGFLTSGDEETVEGVKRRLEYLKRSAEEAEAEKPKNEIDGIQFIDLNICEPSTATA